MSEKEPTLSDLFERHREALLKAAKERMRERSSFYQTFFVGVDFGSADGSSTSYQAYYAPTPPKGTVDLLSPEGELLMRDGKLVK